MAKDGKDNKDKHKLSSMDEFDEGRYILAALIQLIDRASDESDTSSQVLPTSTTFDNLASLLSPNSSEEFIESECTNSGVETIIDSTENIPHPNNIQSTNSTPNLASPRTPTTTSLASTSSQTIPNTPLTPIPEEGAPGSPKLLVPRLQLQQLQVDTNTIRPPKSPGRSATAESLLPTPTSAKRRKSEIYKSGSKKGGVFAFTTLRRSAISPPPSPSSNGSPPTLNGMAPTVSPPVKQRTPPAKYVS